MPIPHDAPRARALLAAALLLLGSRPAAAAAWVRVETENFVVYGEPGERRVREVAEAFERFREALGRVIPGAPPAVPVPTIVVLFGSARAFDPYRPRFNGRPVEIGGYFFSGEDSNIVALPDGDRGEALRVIFHEYVHLAADNISRSTPVWLNEGLAEYYSTFRVEDGGRRAVVGEPIPSHLRTLRQRRPMTMAELLAVDRTSPDYNERGRQTLFYAQSWALVHMLVSGASGAASPLTGYSRLVRDGTPSPAAWEQVFAGRNIVRELEAYIGQGAWPELRFAFDRSIPPVESDSSEVKEGDAEAVLGDLLRRVATPEAGAARLERAMGAHPPSALARALAGLLWLDRGDPDQARRLLLEAARDQSDWLVQYHVATGLTHLAANGVAAEPGLFAAARNAIERVRSARPGLVHADALAARLDLRQDAELPRALQAVRRARAIAPARDDYVLVEAAVLLRQGEFRAARELAQPLTGAHREPAVQQSAQTFLAQVERLERAALDYIARLQGQPPAPAPSAGRNPPALLSRPLRPDERRVDGLLERINCPPAGVELQVRVEGQIERFVAPSLHDVQFISYRSDGDGVVACAARTPPDRVYVTWRDAPLPGELRRAVAVEFLPLP